MTSNGAGGATAMWPAALTLAERVALWRSAGLARPAPRAEAPAAGGTIALWRAQPPFDDGSWLDRRLASLGLTEESFERLLRVPPDAWRAAAGSTPAWVTQLQSAYLREGDPAGAAAWDVLDDPSGGLLEVARPLISGARRRLREGIDHLAAVAPRPVPFAAAEVERSLGSGLPGLLLPLLDRTLVLELHVAQHRGQLEGSTSRARFESLIGRLRRRDAALELLREYPVLARLLVTSLDQWLEGCLELLGRLVRDASAIRAAFFTADPGPLTNVITMGDPHHRGRSVARLDFESGATVVYKPRPMAIDTRFQELLGWLNEGGIELSHRTLTVLDRGDYGWMEFVQAAACADPEGPRRYHARLGSLLALLHLLEATDFHFENLIAAEDQPVPIDLESILHPRLRRSANAPVDERLGGLLLAHSVLRVGLLPVAAGETEEDVDLSGVASVKGRATPDASLQWDAAGTDQMRAVRRRLTMTGGANRPSFAGREARAEDHLADILAGFRSTYDRILSHRAALAAPEGPLSWFGGVETRAVLRSTRVYGLLLEESLHPDFLRDALDRDRFFDRLWVGIDKQPDLSRVVESERRDLWRGDIPRFASKTGSADVWSSDGQRHEGYFERAAIEAARERLERMDEADRRRQEWLIEMSLATCLMNRPDQQWDRYEVSEPGAFDEGACRSRAIAQARRIGDWFDEMAVRDGEEITWVGLDLREKRWSLNPMSEDLYAGLPGIALFLGQLGALTREPRYSRMAREAIGTLRRQVDCRKDAIRGIGAFQGWGGILYAMAHLGALGDDRGLLAEAQKLVAPLSARVALDEDLDVVAGSAGAIAGLLALHRVTGAPSALATARACGERLISRARPWEGGVAWFTRIGDDAPQTGYSHGAAGIGSALIELWSATADTRFRDMGLSGLACERRIFWPELRQWLAGEEAAAGTTGAPVERMVSMAWCYGAPGIGFSRYGALRRADHADLREELALALRLTIDRGFGQNHCLCHGDLGNLDLLLLADPGAARRPSQIILDGIERHGWLCGTTARVISPGLMNGLAGIGYGLLRLAAPDRVPSVLALMPPIV